jgi:hypothetical protein
MNRKAVASVAALVLMVVLGVYRRAHRSPSLPSDADMVTVMKEAAGTSPIPSVDPPIRKAIRDSFKYILDENKSYTDEADRRFATRYLRNLLHPYSFAAAPYRQGAITELQALKELDQQHLAAVQRFPEVAKANMLSAGISEADAEGFAGGIRKGMGDEFARATDLELKWLDAVLQLYQFTEENSSHIGTPSTSELMFDDDSVRSQFNEMAAKVDALGDQSAKAAAAFDTTQRRRQRMRLSSRNTSQP